METKRAVPGDYEVTVYHPASPRNGLPHRNIVAVYRVCEHAAGDWEITRKGQHVAYSGRKADALTRIADIHGV